MQVFYFIPVFFILVILLFVIGGIYAISAEIYMILAVVVTIFVGGIVGGLVLVSAFSKASSTKRFYLMLPGVLFFAFGAGAVWMFRQSFCLSEKWSQPSGFGTLMIHSSEVFRWAILATLIISFVFVIFFSISYNAQKGIISLLFSVISCFILIVPIFMTHSYCEQEYYEKNSTSYEQVYTVKKDVDVKLYINENYQGLGLTITGNYDLIRILFPKKLKEGETVYGEAYDSETIEVFNANGVIGDVPAEFLEPQ